MLTLSTTQSCGPSLRYLSVLEAINRFWCISVFNLFLHWLNMGWIVGLGWWFGRSLDENLRLKKMGQFGAQRLHVNSAWNGVLCLCLMCLFELRKACCQCDADRDNNEAPELNFNQKRLWFIPLESIEMTLIPICHTQDFCCITNDMSRKHCSISSTKWAVPQ